MINGLLYRLTAGLPCRLINLESGPYLERYYLGEVFGVTFYLHRFVSSDSERHVHNHPWGWGRALILSGGYLEERAVDLCPLIAGSGCVTTFTRRRWYNRVDGHHFHRIHDAEPGTWTLFFHGKRQRVERKDWTHADVEKGWGFLERVMLSRTAATVFTPYPSAKSQWWKTAAVGAKVGRVPL